MRTTLKGKPQALAISSDTIFVGLETGFYIVFDDPFYLKE